ncbi:MAG: Ni/Fe hydrogenase subunit gamma [Rhodospirillales bacterium]|nr:MAG: Ni/Fe hydrogenase subunit gamma [Rhodospirillales bacterium]
MPEPRQETAPAARTPDLMAPRPFTVERVTRDVSDTFTLELRPLEGPPLAFQPGQFTMLYLFGVGEVAISVSGDPDRPERLVQTIRAVGPVTRAMTALKPGAVVGVRGPFGRPWPCAEIEGRDVVVVAGGVGLAPLRPAILHVLARRGQYGKVALLCGARTPKDILFRRDLRRWGGRLDTSVAVTVDRASAGWHGQVGVVTKLIGHAPFDPEEAAALVCGPEIMIRYTVQALNDRGVSLDRIYVSMERNMKCAVGFCGHCQFGGSFVCRDGPVFRFDRIADRFAVREL